MIRTGLPKLNLGCGKDIKKGYLNLDLRDYQGVDAVWDLNVLPLPFKDSQFEEILCQDVLEHVDFVPLMDELYRILKPRGMLKIRVPHFTSANAYVDPTHIRFFSSLSFSYFVKGAQLDYRFKKFSSMRVHLQFERRPLLFWNYLLAPLVNLSNSTRSLYERTPLRIFPATNLLVCLVK